MNKDYISIILKNDFPQGFAVKSNICLKNQNIHCNSKILFEKFFPQFNAKVIELLLAKQFQPNMICHADEFAMGGIGYSDLHGITLHPENSNNIVGGSSSGICKAVWKNEAIFGLGSSTGGSIRIPGALCNLFAFEPSYGACSRVGLVSFASSLDKVGWVAKKIETIIDVANIIIQTDCNDMTSIEISRSITLKNKILVFADEDLQKYLNIEVFAKYLEIKKELSKNYQITTLTHQDFKTIILTSSTNYFILSSVEAMSSLQRFNGLRLNQSNPEQTFSQCLEETRNIFGSQVTERLAFAKKILKKYPNIYAQAIQDRTLLKEYISTLLENADGVFLPTLFKNSISVLESEIQETNLKLDMFSSWVNLIHGCAINMPLNSIQVQLTGKQGQDFTILQIASDIISKYKNE